MGIRKRLSYVYLCVRTRACVGVRTRVRVCVRLRFCACACVDTRVHMIRTCIVPTGGGTRVLTKNRNRLTCRKNLICGFVRSIDSLIEVVGVLYMVFNLVKVLKYLRKLFHARENRG